MQTDGVNFAAAWANDDLVDCANVKTNDVYAMMRTYGVEAARGTIVSEVLNVFGAYGISVDPRHLNLIADYMTFEGGYRPLNRMGIAGNASPLLRMSFETSMNFMTEACLHGEDDNLESPSSRIVMGQVVKGGTGMMTLMQPVTEKEAGGAQAMAY